MWDGGRGIRILGQELGGIGGHRYLGLHLLLVLTAIREGFDFTCHIYEYYNQSGL